jgi:hypothetical protein
VVVIVRAQDEGVWLSLYMPDYGLLNACEGLAHMLQAVSYRRWLWNDSGKDGKDEGRRMKDE